MNTLLKATIKDGWHVITSSMEHNSVLRPLKTLESSVNYNLSIIETDHSGLIDIDAFKSIINKQTKLAVFSYASNVTGLIQPLKEIGAICRENSIYLIIDSAQAAGHFSINFEDLYFSALAFSGHKALLGPQGIGGFLIDEAFNSEASSFIEGGTGSLSESLTQPCFLPDKFESGTLNLPACLGLLKSIEYINKIGLNYIKDYENSLTLKLATGLLQLDDINLVGYNSNYEYTPTLSITSKTVPSHELAYLLDKNYGISVRQGLHCAPLAHKSLGTFPQGTVRLSLGIMNNSIEVDSVLSAISSIVKKGY